jgi:spore maturation protein CgeB
VTDHVLSSGLDVVFFGSDAVDDDAAYHHGILGALAERGHRVAVHRADPAVMLAAVPRAADADVILKASGEGVLDAMLDGAVLGQRRPGQRIMYWDAHAHATLRRLDGDPSRYRAKIPRFDLVFTSSGGDTVVRGYEAIGARRCVPLHVALDPDAQPPATPTPAFAAALSLLASPGPGGDVAHVDAFFFAAARALPERRFVLGGSGWDAASLPFGVRWAGEVGPAARAAFHASAGVVLHLGREGDGPEARLLEAACAGACVISDAWEGLDRFLTPGREVLVARDGQDVARLLRALGPGEARAIGQAARRRVLAEHTYARRAAVLERWIAPPRPS